MPDSLLASFAFLALLVASVAALWLHTHGWRGIVDTLRLARSLARLAWVFMRLVFTVSRR